jgi:hypothetical protein
MELTKDEEDEASTGTGAGAEYGDGREGRDGGGNLGGCEDVNPPKEISASKSGSKSGTTGGAGCRF